MPYRQQDYPMSQKAVWEKEYHNPQLVTKDSKPQKDILRFIRFLKKQEGVLCHGLHILDLGCGTGRNANYFASLGNTVIAYDIAKNAVDLGKERAKDLAVDVHYEVKNIGEPYNLQNDSMDIILDITSSNSLNESEREVCLSEMYRVLKPGGYVFVKTLCKDGDKHAKNLIKLSPGKEYDTYINKEMGLTERVFSKMDFEKLYGAYFSFLSLTKKISYTRFNNKSYKRHFWLAYMKK